MIVDFANNPRFREDIPSARSGESAHESFKGVRGKSVGASELGSWKSNHTDHSTAKPGFFHAQLVGEVEARTTAIDHLEAELDRQITRSNRLRQSTLAAAFSGSLTT